MGIDIDKYPPIIIGSEKLKIKRGDHFTSDRFIAMMVRAFRNHDRIVVYTNQKTEEFASGIISLFCDAFRIIKEEKSLVKVTKRDGKVVPAIRYVLDKIPSIRRE